MRGRWFAMSARLSTDCCQSSSLCIYPASFPRQHTDRAEQLTLYTNRARNTPYLACWCALDAMTTTNGTLLVVQQSALMQWQASQHRDVTDGDVDDGAAVIVPEHAWLDRHSIPLVVPAGSVVLFDADFWHASGGNMSDAVRRVFYVQYSLQPIAATMHTVESAAVLSTQAAPRQKKLRTEEGASSFAGSDESGSSSSVASVATAICVACGSSECVTLAQQLDPLSFAIPCALK